MRIPRPSPSMAVAGVALFVSLGGTSVAAVTYASRAGEVDGKSAVYSGATLAQSAGKLVATERSGDHKGRLPGKFLADVGKTQVFSNAIDVADNAAGAPQTQASIGGFGTLTGTCNDQASAAGVEDPSTVVTFVNQSGVTLNAARRVGNGDGTVSAVANQTTTSLTITGANTFTFHLDRGGQQAMITGGVRQDGSRTATGRCVVFGVVTNVLP